ncbi:MAG: diguanylate cyclase [Desulfuromonadaceae bacterium]
MPLPRSIKPSRTLLLSILLPLAVSILLFSLVVMTFNIAENRVSAAQEQDIEDLVNFAASAVEQLWIEPRNHAATVLARSTTLHKRIRGEVPFADLAQDWRQVQRSTQGCFYIYYALQDGSIELYPPDPLPHNYDPRKRPWYRTGISATKTPAWTAPYAEIITGDMVVSAVVPLYPQSEPATQGSDPGGVFSMDITLAGLEDMFRGMSLPDGGSIYLVDTEGQPFIASHAESGATDLPQTLPGNSRNTLVNYSDPLSNGWQVGVVLPRTALVQNFAQLRQPVLYGAAALIIFAVIASLISVWRMTARTHRLAEYFRSTMEEEHALKEIFTGKDEFSYLNHHFNQAVEVVRKLHREKLAREQASRFLVERAPIGFFRTDRSGEIIYLNPQFIHMLGYRDLEDILAHISSIEEVYLTPETRTDFIARLDEHGEVQNFKAQLCTKSGAYMWVSITAHIAAPRAEDSFVIQGFILDITRDMEERTELVKQASCDPLTGAANRRTFDAVFERAVQHAVEHREHLSLIEFDLDKFKEINDSLGHAAGDAILCHVAEVAATITRKDDLFARLGGDEFAILLPKADTDAAMHLAERLQEALRHSESPHNYPTPTLSIGISSFSGADTVLESDASIPDAASLMRAADVAMYRAKQRGRNQIACASAEEELSE